MLAKGRLLGIQFIGLFEDDLYFSLSEHAVSQALKIRDAFRQKGYAFLVDSPHFLILLGQIPELFGS